MQELTIDLQGVKVDLLRTDDNPVLADAIHEATDPTRSTDDGAGFDNKI